jgi:hypothetical protein
VVIYTPDNRRVWSTNTLPPTVSSFAPASGQVGDAITIIGSSFINVQRVLIDSISATYTANTWTAITAVIPEAARSGKISVLTPIGSAHSIEKFIVVPTPPPTISGFTPVQGKVGVGVTISGSNFSRATAVTFNGINANFQIASDAIITTTVPGNADDGPISVVNRGGRATSAKSFDVKAAEQPANLAFINTWMQPTEFPPPNSPFIIYFSFFNGGGTETGKFLVRLQLDNGAAHTDISIGSYPPGAGDFVYWNFPHGLPAGDHFIYAYLDALNVVAEVNESDNVSYHAFSVE